MKPERHKTRCQTHEGSDKVEVRNYLTVTGTSQADKPEPKQKHHEPQVISRLGFHIALFQSSPTKN